MALMPEIKIEQLQPIEFGPNDEDRVKDMFEKVFLMEYAHCRERRELDWDLAIKHSAASAEVACEDYRRWLKEQEAES